LRMKMVRSEYNHILLFRIAVLDCMATAASRMQLRSIKLKDYTAFAALRASAML
jgi:predicted LPLAT superfamily acyltransferase